MSCTGEELLWLPIGNIPTDTGELTVQLQLTSTTAGASSAARKILAALEQGRPVYFVGAVCDDGGSGRWSLVELGGNTLIDQLRIGYPWLPCRVRTTLSRWKLSLVGPTAGAALGVLLGFKIGCGCDEEKR